MAHPQDTTLTPIKHHVIMTDYASTVARAGLEVAHDCDFLAPPQVHGFPSLLHYTSPNSGRTVYVLELCGQCDVDRWEHDVWQFASPLSVADAQGFLARAARNVYAPAGLPLEYAALVARRDRLEAQYLQALRDRSPDVILISEALAEIELEGSCAWPRVELDPRQLPDGSWLPEGMSIMEWMIMGGEV